jgi:hypothetical protein
MQHSTCSLPMAPWRVKHKKRNWRRDCRLAVDGRSAGKDNQHQKVDLFMPHWTTGRMDGIDQDESCFEMDC